MAKDKKSFIAYVNWKSTFDALPNEQAGELIKHIFAYVNDENPITEDVLINAVFANIKDTLKRDLDKYKDQVEINRINGAKGGRPRKSEKTQSVILETEPKRKKHDSVNDTVNEEKKYIYNAFYDSEISKANSTNYTNFVKYLFGENMLKEKLVGVLSIKSQLTFDEYKKISTKCEVNKLKLGQILTKIENDVKYYKGKKSLYRTLLNWAEGRFAK